MTTLSDQTGLNSLQHSVPTTSDPVKRPSNKVSDTQIAALKNCITETLKSYHKKRRRNKWGAVTVHILTIGFSTATTILLGWKLADNSAVTGRVQNIALILSAFATGASTLEGVFDYRALWVGYNVSIARMKAVLTRLTYLEALGSDNLEHNQIEELYTQYANICSSMEKDYKDIRTSDT